MTSYSTLIETIRLSYHFEFGIISLYPTFSRFDIIPIFQILVDSVVNLQ